VAGLDVSSNEILLTRHINSKLQDVLPTIEGLSAILSSIRRMADQGSEYDEEIESLANHGVFCADDLFSKMSALSDLMKKAIHEAPANSSI
jgi:hypothetical protein